MHTTFSVAIPPLPSPSGAPISNLTAVVINSTAASLSWSHPPSLFYFSLQTYHVQYGISGLSPRETLEYGREVNFVLFEELEEATQYQFSVYGVYGDGVQGVEVTVTATTEEDGELHSHQDNIKMMSPLSLSVIYTHMFTQFQQLLLRMCLWMVRWRHWISHGW